MRPFPAANPLVAVVGLCPPSMWEMDCAFSLRLKPTRPCVGTTGQASVWAVSRFGPPSRPSCRPRCSWPLGRHSHSGPSLFSIRPSFRLSGVVPSCNSHSMMTPVNTPHGGIGASVALRRAPQGHWECPAAGTSAVAGAIPTKNSARNLDSQFLESEGEMSAIVKTPRIAGLRRLGAASSAIGCRIIRPTANLCPILNPDRISTQ